MSPFLSVSDYFFKKAAVASGMTGISNLIHLGKEGIFITVGIKLLHILEMTACLTLDPEFIPAPAEIGHPAGGKGLFVGFFVHISYHQYLQRLFVLDHYRNMTIRIFLSSLHGI